MKKKLCMVVLVLICVLSCAFGLIACEVRENPNGDEHTHYYSEDWKSNETHHWHECLNSGCDAKEIDKAEHDFSKGNCICGAKKPSEAEKVLKNLAKAYTNSDLETLAKTVYENGSLGYNFYIQNNTAEKVFQGYKKLQIQSAELLYDDGLDAGFEVTATLTYELNIDNKKTTESVELKGNVYFVYKQSNWYLTEFPTIDIMRKTISTRENDGSELYYGDNIFTTVPVLAETDYTDSNNIIQRITVLTESSSLNIQNYFKCYNNKWEIRTKMNMGLSDWTTATNVQSQYMKYPWKIEVYDERNEMVEEWELKFVYKDYITVTFYDNDKETSLGKQEFKAYKKASEKSAPVKNGLTFVGWITSNGELFDFKQRVERDLSLYAAYVNDATKKITEDIASLNNLTLEDRVKLDGIQSAIDALSDEDKELVYNYRKFENALSQMLSMEWDFEFYMDPYGSYYFYIIHAYKGLSDVVRVPDKNGIAEVRTVSNNVFGDKNIKELYIPGTVTSFGDQSGSLNGAVIYCANKTKPSGYSDNFAGNAAVVVWDAIDTLTVGNMTYVLRADNKASLVKATSLVDGTLIIPEKVNDYNVIGIEQGALDGLQINSLDVPYCLISFITVDTVDTLIVRGVDKIESDSFACIKDISINSIVLYGSAQKIAASAFEDFASVAEFAMPDSVTSIENYSFKGCVNLISIAITNNVTLIGDYAFDGCKNLTNVIIGAGVTSIGSNAFNNCQRLVEIYNLSDLSITKGSSNNGGIAYYAKIVHTSLTEQSVLTTIESKFVFCDVEEGCCLIAYKGDEKNVELPDAFNGKGYAINNYAFFNCTELTTISVPNSVTTVGKYAFEGCDKLQYNEYDNALYLGNESNPYVILVKAKSDNITSCTINEDTKVVNVSAFNGCGSLGSIIIPNSVILIGDSAFNGCSSLESITLPFVGGSIKTSSDTFQYPLGYIFGTSSYTGGTATRQDYYGNSTSNITSTTYYIPSSLKNVTIAGGNIPYGAFYGCNKLTSITISDGVTEIGNFAFYDCRRLEGVYYTGDIAGWCNIDFGVNYANPVFYAQNLYIDNELVTGDLVIPNNATEIKYHAFNGCGGLTSVTIGSSVIAIDSSAFFGCGSLESIIVDENNPAYASQDGVLYNKERTQIVCVPKAIIGSVTIPNDVTKIDTGVFSGCDNLTSVIIGNNVTEICYGAFSGCSNLISVTIGNGVTTIGNYAFSSCNNLETVYWNAQACKNKNVSNSVWEWCTNLTEIVIGSNVTEIPDSVFDNCKTLERISVNENNARYASQDGILYIKSKTRIECIPKAIKGSITIPAGVTRIDRESFKDRIYITNITLPDSVTEISYGAFSGCSNLISVTIPESVTSIGSSAFYGCKKLTSVTIPESITSIDDNAFYDCDELRYNEYGNALYLGNTNNPYLVLSKAMSTDSTSYTIYNNTKIICNSAFAWCDKLTSVTIPESVTSIGSYAFYGCSGLEEVYYEGNIEGWCKISFRDHFANPLYYAQNLYIDNEIVTGEIVIPDSVTAINSYAFYGYANITSVTIPDSVTSIGGSTFSGCSNLATVYWNATSCASIGRGEHSIFGGDARLTTVIIGENVTKMPMDIFDNCNNLTNVYYAGDMASWCDIDFYAGWISSLYYSVPNLYIDNELVTEVVIPDSVTKIKQYAFCYCTSITSVIIPSSVTIIEDSAFYGCGGLTIYCEVANRPMGNGINGWDSMWNASKSPVIWNCKNNNKDENGYEYAVIDGIRYALKNNIATVIGQPGNITVANIPSKVTYKNVEYTVTSIDSSAFDNIGLTSVVIPISIEKIGDWTFGYYDNITKVYYKGTADDWAKINISDTDNDLTTITFYYYSETEPELNNDGTDYNGNYWHYDVDGATPIIWVKDN